MNTDQFIKTKVAEIKEAVTAGEAVVATSGGIDSTTCAALAYRALGEHLTAVFIDHGLMRAGEPETVTQLLRGLELQVELIKAADEFFAALAGVTAPELKRIAFRETFYRVLGEFIRRTGGTHLIQGTIAADVQETVAGIKAQHNVLSQIGIDPQQWGFAVIEPLKDLYKPGVRQLAQALNLPSEVYERMPFPGPGLALRVLGEVTPERVALVRHATRIVEEEIAPLRVSPEEPFQALAVLLNDQSTGVINNQRAFGPIIVVRVVNSRDALTAAPTVLTDRVENAIVSRILDELPSVVRVLFDHTPKPPSTIEFI